MLQIINGQILTPQGWLKGGSVVVEGTKIVEVSNNCLAIEGADRVDVHGAYVLPGGVEMHCHGGGGCDFRLGTEEAFQTAIDSHLRHGSTSIYPTVSASPKEVLTGAWQTCQRMMDADPLSPILGLHLEGNYLSPKKAGAQLPGVLTDPNPEEYLAMLEDWHCLRRWDAAPELPGALDFARACRERGVVVSIAHTNANYDEARLGFEAGFTHVTHFYNATPTFHNRREYKEAGTVEAAYLIDDMTIECIADGIHVPPPMLRMAYKIKGVDCMALVTDGMACSAGDSDETYDPRFILEDGVCKLKDRSALAGSIATMDRLIRTAVQLAEIPLADAVRMVTDTPARIMGVTERKGTLQRGKDADILVLDKELYPQAVWQMGRRVISD